MAGAADCAAAEGKLLSYETERPGRVKMGPFVAGLFDRMTGCDEMGERKRMELCNGGATGKPDDKINRKVAIFP